MKLTDHKFVFTWPCKIRHCYYELFFVKKWEVQLQPTKRVSSPHHTEYVLVVCVCQFWQEHSYICSVWSHPQLSTTLIKCSGTCFLPLFHCTSVNIFFPSLPNVIGYLDKEALKMAETIQNKLQEMTCLAQEIIKNSCVTELKTTKCCWSLIFASNLTSYVQKLYISIRVVTFLCNAWNDKNV